MWWPLRVLFETSKSHFLNRWMNWKQVKVIWPNDSYGHESCFFTFNAIFRNPSYVGKEIQYTRLSCFYAVIFPRCVIISFGSEKRSIIPSSHYLFVLDFLCFNFPTGLSRVPSRTLSLFFSNYSCRPQVGASKRRSVYKRISRTLVPYKLKDVWRNDAIWI